jgi:hypothetical protein
MTGRGFEGISYIKDMLTEAVSKKRELDKEMLEKYQVLETLQLENIKLERENQYLKKTYESNECEYESVIEECRNDYLAVLGLHNVKMKKYKSLKLKLLLLTDKIANVVKEVEQYIGLRQILSAELPDTPIRDLENEIYRKDEIISQLTQECNKLELELGKNETEYNYLIHKKSELNFQIKVLEGKLSSFDENSIYEEFKSFTLILKKNKKIYEKNEKVLNYSLFFIRFSNSLVRSFFNIINVRRVQIKLIETSSKDTLYGYKFLFKKLDELELNLISEYKDYLSLLD